MAVPSLGLRLRHCLGPEASEELSNAIEEGQNDMLSMTCERFEQRLIAVSAELRAEIGRAQSELRQEMTTMDAGIRVALTEGLSKIRVEMTDMRVDVLRWHSYRYVGYKADLTTRLLDEGVSFKEVPVPCIPRTAGRSQAIRLRNVISLMVGLADMLLRRFSKERIPCIRLSSTEPKLLDEHPSSSNSRPPSNQRPSAEASRIVQ